MKSLAPVRFWLWPARAVESHEHVDAVRARVLVHHAVLFVAPGGWVGSYTMGVVLN